jgi:RNA polymerase sigma factor (sigma-70 family)
MIKIDDDFVRQWKPLILKLLRETGQGFNEEQMDEVLHNTWVNLLRNARYYTPHYAVSTFIRLQTLNAVAEYIKGDIEGDDCMTRKVSSDIPDEADDDDEYDAEALRKLVSPLFCHLTDTERLVFSDRVLNGLSVAEVASKHNLHKKSVSRLTARVTNKLRSMIVSGRKINGKREVAKGFPLETAIMQMDDAHYHTFRMHHFEEMSLILISERNGMSIERNLQLLQEAKQFIEQEWGIKV